MKFEVREIERPHDVTKFIKSQWNFYKGDSNWVPPLLLDRKKLLNTKKNPFYKHSKIQLFLAESEGNVVGRIAAIINGNHNKTHNDKLGFFGFFECVNNDEVASALFDAAGNWLKSNGMDSVRGPVNPSQNDETGLLVDGFDSPPKILMTYNPEYYIQLIENYGFKKAKDLYAYKLQYKEFVSDKLERMQKIVRERNGITIRCMDFKNKEQFLKDIELIKEVYNAAWEPNYGFVKLTDEEFDFMAADLKPIADPEFAYIVEMKGKPVGFSLALPDINQCLIHNKKGGTLGALWHLMTKKKKIDTVRIIILGIDPKYQKTGVDAVLYYEYKIKAEANNIPYGEASWILEDNEMMNRGLTTTMLGVVYKTYRLYEKAL